MRAAERQHRLLQQVRHHAGQGAQPDMPAPRGGRATDAIRGFVQVLQHAQGVAQKPLAQLGQVGACPAAGEQTCAKQLLQLGQGLGNSGLAKAKLLSGLAQVLGLRHGHEAMEVAQANPVAEGGLEGGLHIEKLCK